MTRLLIQGPRIIYRGGLEECLDVGERRQVIEREFHPDGTEIRSRITDRTVMLLPEHMWRGRGRAAA
jgi:hypothetical protein